MKNRYLPLVVIVAFQLSITNLSAQNFTGGTSIGANGGGSTLAPCTEILRFDNYLDNNAGGNTGQKFVFVLGNGDSLFLNVQRTGYGINAAVAPVNPATSFGRYGYTGLSGNTVLYQNDPTTNDNTTLTFSNILLKSAKGDTVTNFKLAVYDGESTGYWENLSFAAPAPGFGVSTIPCHRLLLFAHPLPQA